MTLLQYYDFINDEEDDFNDLPPSTMASSLKFSRIFRARILW